MKKVFCISVMLVGFLLVGCDDEFWKMEVTVCGDPHEVVPLNQLVLTNELGEWFSVDREEIQSYATREHETENLTFWTVRGYENLAIPNNHKYKLEVIPSDGWVVAYADNEVDTGDDEKTVIRVELIQEGYTDMECDNTTFFWEEEGEGGAE